MRPIRILGVDPGSRLTGFGCIDRMGQQLRHVASGTLRLSNTGGRAVIPLEERLYSIYTGLSDVIREHKPQIMAVEKVFFAKNAVSALKLGQARGAAVLTGRIHGLEIVEYNPTEVKQTVTGQGQADKVQVARMVELLLGKREFDTSDASDGLALAICHAYRGLFEGAPRTPGASSAKLPAATQLPGTRSRKRYSLAEAVGLAGPEAQTARAKARSR
jgi:crossover junction endodeoxyribonuclease RuvC